MAKLIMSPGTGPVAKQKNKERHALSGWPMIIAWAGMIVFAFHSSTHMVGAGDTWVAMACGRHFINHGVDTVEPFSANSHKAGPTLKEIKDWPDWAKCMVDVDAEDIEFNEENVHWLGRLLLPKFDLETIKYWHPTGWVNQNWLTHVIFYGLTHLSPMADGPPDNWDNVDESSRYSYDTLVYWKIGLYILTVICVSYTGRILGVNPALSAVFACFAMFIGRSFFDIRPAGFSNLLVAVFLLVLVLATYRNIIYIWFVVPLTVFWCNLHGGYIYVFIVLVLFFAFHIFTLFFSKHFVSIGLRGLIHTAIVGITTFISCIIFNPFHLTNFTHTFVISLSKHAEMWRTVHEWHPAFAWSNPVGTGFPFLVLVVITSGLAVMWIFSRFIITRRQVGIKNVPAEEKLPNVLSVFGWAMAIFICWVLFISLSFCRVWPGLLITFLFVIPILLSIRFNIHLIYLLVPITLIITGIGKESHPNNYMGTYIYPFLIVPIYAGIHTIASGVCKKVRYKPSNILFVLLASVAAVVLMVIIYNPFKFKPIDGEIFAYLKQFINIKRPWKPSYEANLGFLTKSYNLRLFNGLYVANALSVIVWLLAPVLKKLLGSRDDSEQHNRQWSAYVLPRIDIAFIAVCVLTIFMALKSRRFIPIAAFAACPVAAMFIEQITRALSACLNYYKKGALKVSPVPKSLQKLFICSGAFAVLLFGTLWSLQFKKVYLDPWPQDDKLTSVFMRMTASYAKPFWACQFIRENNISGKMFNYWTEGGFIAYGQIPGEKGKTPLQLFMDGRAQAAYDTDAFLRWSRIMAGTTRGAKIAEAAKARRRNLNRQEYMEIGEELTKQFRKDDVWVVLMPFNDKTSIITNSLELHPEWALVFYNSKQKLYVDITKPEGEKLFIGISSGATKFPDDLSKHLTLAHVFLSSNVDSTLIKNGFNSALTALKVLPCQHAMIEVVSAGRFKALAPAVRSACEGFLDDFNKNKDSYKKQPNYIDHAFAAVRATMHLSDLANGRKEVKQARKYRNKADELNNEMRKLNRNMKW